MKKTILLFLVPLLFFIGNPAKANILEHKEQVKQIVGQREEVKKKIMAAGDKEKIKLHIQDNKLAARQAAYEKAIELATNEQKETTAAAAFPNFTPVKLLPGNNVPLEYIPYYQAAAQRFGVDWFVLASIHDIETSFSTHSTMISSAGAIGHMQFMPSTFAAYAIDGDGDGQASAWSLPDSIFTAANYLSSNGYGKDKRKAIWHYNHADWYVNKVLFNAERIANGS